MTESSVVKTSAGDASLGEVSGTESSSTFDEASSGALGSGEMEFLRAATATSKHEPTSEEPDRSGTLLGKYKVLEELGRGGMGIVYAAEDQKLRRRVALKVLPSKLARHPERLQRLLREARAASAISHANVATVFDVDETADGDAYIAMELVEGRSLRSLIREGPVDVIDAVRIGREVLLGLGKAHEVGIIHRDLKPDNVMILSNGSIKLLDFGLAKPVGPQESTLDAEPLEHSDVVTMEGRVVGTPSYMSPEQARGEPVDARSDLFSFGILLYEMLTGRRPFAAHSTTELLTSIDRDRPTPVSKLRPEVPQGLEQVVEQCLAKKPDQRFASCEALISALDAAVTPRTSARRAVLAVAFAGAVAIAISTWVVVGASSSGRQSVAAELPAPSAEPGLSADARRAAAAAPSFEAPAEAPGTAMPGATAGASAPRASVRPPRRPAPAPSIRAPVSPPAASAPATPKPAKSQGSLQQQVVGEPPF